MFTKYRVTKTCDMKILKVYVTKKKIISLILFWNNTVFIWYRGVLIFKQTDLIYKVTAFDLKIYRKLKKNVLVSMATNNNILCS